MPYVPSPTPRDPDPVLQRLIAPKIAKMRESMGKSEKRHYQNVRLKNKFTQLRRQITVVEVLDPGLKSSFIKASKRVNQNPWTILHNLGLA